MVKIVGSTNNNMGITRQYSPKQGQVSKANIANDKVNAGSVILDFENKDLDTAVTYRRPKTHNIDQNEINKLIEEARKSYNGLREIVQKLIVQQKKNNKDSLMNKGIGEVDEKDRLEAQEAISENGEWGIEAVSDSIVNFAIAISGNDKGKFEELRAAIEKGFREAERIFGGQLPEISHKTYEVTMDKLNSWYESGD